MPSVNVRIVRGATREQKSASVHDIPRSLQEVLGRAPEHTHVVIDEVDEENWGFAGMLTNDWRAAQAEPEAGAEAEAPTPEAG